MVYLRQIEAATNYGERHLLLKDYPVQDDFIVPLVWDITNGDVTISEYTDEQKKALAKHSVTNDQDPGPYNAWLWAHTDSEDYKYFFSEPHAPLRKRGYVMWDHARLVDEWNLFSRPFENIENETGDEFTHSDEYIEYSYDRRSRIFMTGGTGWWSKDDESKIVWPKSNE